MLMVQASADTTRETAQRVASRKQHPAILASTLRHVPLLSTRTTTGSPWWTTHGDQGSSRDTLNLQKL